MPSDLGSSSGNAADQVTKLREQVETLMRDRVTPYVADAASRAGSAARTASDAVKGQADAISGHVQDYPLMSILAAAGFGWLIGRFWR
jgi:ElaB/YqjD/DUF883 family membrane-anchored ribosome-binding protein